MSPTGTPTPSIIEVRELDTAEELFAALSPITGNIWRRGLEGADWLFRGQGNGVDGSIWKLRPSAFRPRAFLKYLRGQIDDVPAENGREQRDRELSAVMSFANRADREGHLIPGDSHEIRDRRFAAERSATHREFPPAPLTALFGLAQHHGVPTRLLDWTIKPLVAIYFAVEQVAKRREPGKQMPPGEAPFSVFALRRAVFNAAERLEPWIVPINVPTATNANLHAQGGMFTLVQLLDRDEHPLPDITDTLERNADRIATRHDGAHRPLFPFLIEFRVPAREARTALMLLAKMGISAASVYPGLGGVARALEESRYYQVAREGERS